LTLEALAKVSNVHPRPSLASLCDAGRAREGNTPLHPSQEGIYPLPLRSTTRRGEGKGKG